MSAGLDRELGPLLARKLLAMGDDELILAHRNSEWTGHAPILEEDIAFSNIAQDELGHSAVWYGLLSELTGDKPDDLIFFRDAEGYRNVQLVELPIGDWSFSMLRQYLFDTFEIARATRLSDSEYRPLAQAAAKVRQEELYHYRHTSSWIRRLGQGTEESKLRTQRALDTQWPYARQLFAPLPDEDQLVEASLVPNLDDLHLAWSAMVVPFLAESGLQIPATGALPAEQRDQHTQHLSELLAELQEVARMEPGAQW